ncbi:MAG: NUDIX hydrolase [Legionellaceae bacterium]|nr:NUDIX hydrolase [Legionellaceae bacterium]MBP9774490.1 NUDIX hydrolase [Legionellaceae bacterium]
MTIKDKQWLLWISELQAIGQCGLTYTTSDFDRERFIRLTELAAEMASELALSPPETIKAMFTLEQNAYATPILDIRSFVLKNDKILLVKERSDCLWTLPGGFADVNESPSEAVVRETFEESGFLVKPRYLLALWDKLKHDHPLAWPHIYKCVFHCDLVSGEARSNIEISDIDFFSIDLLPDLSTPRVTRKQLETLYALTRNSQATVFD